MTTETSVLIPAKHLQFAEMVSAALLRIADFALKIVEHVKAVAASPMTHLDAKTRKSRPVCAELIPPAVRWHGTIHVWSTPTNAVPVMGSAVRLMTLRAASTMKWNCVFVIFSALPNVVRMNGLRNA